MFATNPFALFPSGGPGMTTDVITADDDYRVPLGVTEIFVQVWAPGVPGFVYPSGGGTGGGYVEGRMPVIPDSNIACLFVPEQYTQFGDGGHTNSIIARNGNAPGSASDDCTDVVMTAGGGGDGGLVDQYGGGGGGAGGPTGPGTNADGKNGGIGNAPGGNGGNGGSIGGADNGGNGVIPGGGGGSAYQAPNVGGAAGRGEIRITYITP